MWRFSGVLALMLLPVAALSADDATAEPTDADAQQWGTVTGRVVFSGDVDDPLLDRFRGEIPVYEGARSLRAAAGLNPGNPSSLRQIGVEINRTLLIDESTRGIKDAFVYLRKPPDAIHPRYHDEEPEDIKIVSRHTRFVPRARVVQLGQSVNFQNLSPTYLTNVHIFTIRNSGFNSAFEPLQQREWTPRRTEPFPIKIQSDIWPMAKSWLLVLDHPYAAVTAKDGTFTIPDLPVGEHRLTFWHETVGYVEKYVTVTVDEGATTEMPDCELTLERLRKKYQQ